MTYEIKDAHVSYFVCDSALEDAKPSELARYFDRALIYKEGTGISTAGGRGQTLLYTLDKRDLVLRHYLRGGLWGKMMGDRYSVFTGDSERALLELELLDILYRYGLPVPKPFIARQERQGAFLKNDIVIYRVPDSRDLFYILKERELTHQELAEIGRVLRRFFAHDVVHTDLNIHNILLSSTGKVSLIDFDRCRQTLLREAHKKAMLERLERSFAKEMRKDPKLHFKVGDFEVIKRHALKKEN